MTDPANGKYERRLKATASMLEALSLRESTLVPAIARIEAARYFAPYAPTNESVLAILENIHGKLEDANCYACMTAAHIHSPNADNSFIVECYYAACDCICIARAELDAFVEMLEDIDDKTIAKAWLPVTDALRPGIEGFGATLTAMSLTTAIKLTEKGYGA